MDVADCLNEGIDYVQEKFLGQGPQNNESAIEQAKDEQISDCKSHDRYDKLGTFLSNKRVSYSQPVQGSDWKGLSRRRQINDLYPTMEKGMHS
jgi:hypothetical protein